MGALRGSKKFRRNVKKAAEAVIQADAVLFAAGAGMGVDSGLPDFRGDEGFWNAYPPFRASGLSFIDLANPTWFKEDPGLAWGFYGHRLNLYRATKPHAGFHILRSLSEQKKDGCFVFTSNVDGQFQRAGFRQEEVAECHGSIHHMQCSARCSNDPNSVWPGDNARVTVDEETFRAIGELPRCPSCGEIARPNILMFGDFDWLHGRGHTQDIRFREWLNSLYGEHEDPGKLVIIECGAGTAIPSVRLETEMLASALKATLIRINPRECEGPQEFTISLPVGALEGIEEVVEQMLLFS